ncbi:MAG: metallophosphoesterase [Pseudomonadales bacterium]|jgi:hypothetical protein|nr:metallophosphoesterase [Pseudomonadales bacterium]MDP6471824.1 metallophosphoesterase [Pseudomonadales bacterium]MDP6828762.1 metallophosphoesterase [Pseudomonadales bacterium]MDP6970305.1 metallophosphoesterase [Pseudomonadales bacterium]|tara:strand:- start:1867 stop:2931 length:1065 start_codon:yes stop_codon:yes gene_type:complete
MLRLFSAIVITTFYFGLLIYPVLRIIDLIAPQVAFNTPFLLTVIVAPLLPRMLYEWRSGRFTRVCAALAFTWLGCYFMAFIPVLAFEAMNLALPLHPATAGWTLVLITAVLCLYAFLNAQRLRVTDIDVAAPAYVGGLRIAQISDVHVGSRRSGFLERVIERLNMLQPDVVMITGDLIDFHAVGEEELASLARLDAPAYFCAGNHERYVGLEDICERLRNLGVHVLRNESVEVGDLQIIAIDDADSRSQVKRFLPAIEALPGHFRILLYHRPDGAEAAADWGVHLMLCGHTHAGQIFPFNFLVRRMFRRLSGVYHIGTMVLNVSSGTGTWGPVMRLGSASEIGMICLTAKNERF